MAKSFYEQMSRRRMFDLMEKGTMEGRARDVALGKTEGGLAQYEGPLEGTAFYRAQVRRGTEATASAFDRSRVAMRRRANVAGMGYEQPATIGSEGAIEQGRAAALSRVPGEAAVATAPLQMQALGLRTQQAGIYQPLGYESAALGYAGLGLEAQELRKKRQAALWRSIAKLGLTAASPFTGGTTGEMAKGL